jgi:hypothetical protein
MMEDFTIKISSLAEGGYANRSTPNAMLFHTSKRLINQLILLLFGLRIIVTAG